MLNLDSISISVREVDISDMVTGVTIYESIMGMLKGAIAVKDGINFFDEFIGTDLADVQFSYEYIGETKIASFYMDGISNMKIEKQQKNYIIHIASMHESAFAQKINNAFNGRTDQIVEQIFANVSEENATLIIDSQASTSGKYIAPNIPTNLALQHLINHAYDIQNTGMFLYQRFVDDNAIRLTSLGDMMDSEFQDIAGNEVTIKASLMHQGAMGMVAMLGTANTFELREYNMDFIQKLENGLWGEAVESVKLDSTTHKYNISKEATSVSKTKFKLSDKLYDNNIKSIFGNSQGVETSVILNHKIRVFNTDMAVTNMVALPHLGVGMTIGLELGGGNKSYSRQDGKYLVKHIQHNFTIDGGEYMYSQDVGLIR